MNISIIHDDILFVQMQTWSDLRMKLQVVKKQWKLLGNFSLWFLVHKEELGWVTVLIAMWMIVACVYMTLWGGMRQRKNLHSKLDQRKQLKPRVCEFSCRGKKYLSMRIWRRYIVWMRCMRMEKLSVWMFACVVVCCWNDWNMFLFC